ncbi:MAG: FHA domain-containing protein [Candidatus Wenzhouxiangella sp. M2_3B_020]
MEVIVEQLGTTNNVLERQKFDQPTVTLGRALDNDIILADEHVDAHHARLIADDDADEIRIEDAGSVNGIRRPRHKQHVASADVRSGEIFLVGRSRIRIFRADHPVAPAVRIRMSEVFLLWLGKPQVTVMLALLYVVAKVLETWLSTIGEFRWSMIVERNLGETLLFTGLAVGVYFLSVLFRRGGNFLAHLSLLILLFLAASVLDFAHTLAVFNAGDRAYQVLAAAEEARAYVLLFVYFWSILYLAFHIPLLRRTWISAVVVLVWFGVDHLPEDSMRRFIDSQSFPLRQAFLPPELLVVEPESVEAFRSRTASLFGELKDARSEALEERKRRREALRDTGPAPAASEAPADGAEPNRLSPPRGRGPTSR